MLSEAPIPAPTEIPEDLHIDKVKGTGMTVLTLGAASFINYGLSFVFDYADRRIDDLSVIVPIVGSVMMMAAGKLMMNFSDERSRLSNNTAVVDAINSGNVQPSEVDIRIE